MVYGIYILNLKRRIEDNVSFAASNWNLCVPSVSSFCQDWKIIINIKESKFNYVVIIIFYD